MNDQRILELAQQAGCTHKQLEVLELMHKGFTPGQISKILMISQQAVRYRRDGAFRRIQKEAA